MFENRRHSLLPCNPTMADYPGNLTCVTTRRRERDSHYIPPSCSNYNEKTYDLRNLVNLNVFIPSFFDYLPTLFLCNTTYVNIISNVSFITLIFHESMIYTFLMNRCVIYLFIITCCKSFIIDNYL